MNIGSRSAPENNATLTSSSDTARSRPAGAPVSSAPPGTFLVSSAEHDTHRRARACLVTGDDVTATVARYAATGPPLDRVSRLAVAAGSPPPRPRPAGNPSPDHHAARRDDSVTEEPPASDEQEDPDAILLRALSAAPAEGVPVSDLITVTGMSRRWVFCRLRQLAAEGFAIQTVRGYWRAAR
jgi:hypothetical protein